MNVGWDKATSTHWAVEYTKEPEAICREDEPRYKAQYTTHQRTKARVPNPK